ncbi:uncharacterized protein BYT42DRAFT_563018 [Radiomyces spectabilis]|uniref:uncharacterized protein n=1 Tax=Radiomyces spectabilis TaxID=64574 RepID=UPI00221F873E|nr:uncharacterized protein BYT42DRAFT_563018 [Radiomyces spectabilis]KAI8384591.1 hypothetical protein BYT42DRAFT_563018 [Radiomyces spectabilis]
MDIGQTKNPFSRDSSKDTKNPSDTGSGLFKAGDYDTKKSGTTHNAEQGSLIGQTGESMKQGAKHVGDKLSGKQ